MKAQVNISRSLNSYMRPIYFSISIALVNSLLACVNTQADNEYQISFKVLESSVKPDSKKNKNIFIFFDGTANNPQSETNVWRLYQLIHKNNDLQTVAMYIEGVGSVEAAPIVDAALGHGMEPRILRAYDFISQNYKSGDKVFIFGFSRGAHQARAFAGLLSYTGIPVDHVRDKNPYQIPNQIIELVKKKSDKDYKGIWLSWKPGQKPPLVDEIETKLDIRTQAVDIQLLGLWDTVPGSSLKNYGICKEQKGFIKKYLYWLIPGIDKGERYKTDSYPNIYHIVHAVSVDEKRSKFLPLLICPAINSRHTRIDEAWFPGAHADVGGGYQDSSELAGISLNWMIEFLSDYYFFKHKPEILWHPNSLGHWSITDFPANIGSICIDRKIPENAVIHQSYYLRSDFEKSPVLVDGQKRLIKYPMLCSDKM